MLIQSTGDLRRAVRLGDRTFPGCYPLLFICADGGMLCPSCVRENRRQVLEALTGETPNDEWQVIALQSGEAMEEEVLCCHCGDLLVEDPEEGEDRS